MKRFLNLKVNVMSLNSLVCPLETESWAVQGNDQFKNPKKKKKKNPYVFQRGLTLENIWIAIPVTPREDT